MWLYMSTCRITEIITNFYQLGQWFSGQLAKITMCDTMF